MAVHKRDFVLSIHSSVSFSLRFSLFLSICFYLYYYFSVNISLLLFLSLLYLSLHLLLVTFPSLNFPGSTAMGQFSDCIVILMRAECCPAVRIVLEVEIMKEEASYCVMKVEMVIIVGEEER